MPILATITAAEGPDGNVELFSGPSGGVVIWTGSAEVTSSVQL
jgi:hypothetical protein